MNEKHDEFIPIVVFFDFIQKGTDNQILSQ